MLGEYLDPLTLALVFLGAVIGIALLSASIKIVREYERGIVFRLGRLVGAKGPGLFFIIPFVDRMVKTDLRLVAIDVPKQNVITKDNVSVNVDAVVYYRIVDPVKVVVRVRNYNYAVALYAQTTLRDIVGQAELDDLLTKREELNKRLQSILDEMTSPWGVKVVAVTIKDVELPEAMRRAMAKQAEAERWRRARVLEAEGERQAAKIMVDAATIYEQHPIALRLRELQTMVEIAREKNLVIIAETTSALGAVAGTATAISKATQKGRSRS
ncbi:MAG: slipin family protein [Thermoprotei archaeon]|nr:MAG: slipin family protein [Thermoprotei archaeon]